MLGFRLLYLGFKTFARNVLQIIAVGLLPGLMVYAMYLFVDLQIDRIIRPNMRFIISVPIFMITLAIPIAWAGINWHRVIFLKEKPAVLPWIKDGIFASYTWRLMMFIVGAIGITYGFAYTLDFIITTFIVGTRSDMLIVLNALASIVIYYLALSYPLVRLGLCLPGISVGAKTTARQSWSMTAGYTGTIITIVLSLMFIMGVLMTGAVALDWFNTFGWGAFFAVFVFLWLTMLTELYGYIRAQNDVEQVFG